MRIQTTCGAVFALAALACGSDGGAVPASPPPAPPGVVEYYGPAGTTSELAVSGFLQGELRGVSVAGETTANVGSFELLGDGNGSMYASVAAAGEAGAAMLIVNIWQPELDAALANGHWASDDAAVGIAVDTAGENRATAVVSSCAGPSIGEWPYELGATEYEIDSSEDPEDPGHVVLVVKAQFPRTEVDSSSTTELVGTIRFERFAPPD